MRMGDIFLHSLLLLMASGETATHVSCPLAGVFHWKDSSSQYKSSFSVNRSQLASSSRIASTSLNTPPFSTPRPSCCTLWPRKGSGLWNCGESPSWPKGCDAEDGDAERAWERAMFVKKTLVKLHLYCCKSVVLCSFGKAGANWVPNGNPN